jgi:glycosyltransferase involved in cell wall biosynthesis
MKILHLAPLWFPVSQDSHGGIETFLSGHIAALEKLGCRNTLIASGDSSTVGELVSVVPLNLYAQMQAGTAAEYAYYEQHQLLLALELAADYDVVHSHLGWGGYVLSGVPGLQARVLHTQHNPVYQDQEWFIHRHPNIWISTVSKCLADKFWRQGATRCHVINNGTDMATLAFRPRSDGGLLFLGRMEEKKGPDLAVEVARALDRPLILAGPIVDEVFFDHTIRPFLNEQIRYVGVVNHREKTELFGRAACVLMPSRWEEPFGLVAIEAMACGTPVVALARGALPEIVEPGLTGYLGTNEEALADLVARAVQLDRAAIRARATARFDLPTIAERYRQLYLQVAMTQNRTSGGEMETEGGESSANFIWPAS